MEISRRNLLIASAASSVASCASIDKNNNQFQGNWESLSNYKLPNWFANAKFGIWAHWGPQCVPEYGDWYGRQMYQEGNPYYKHHLENYGHPSETGFIDIINKFKGENLQADSLMKLFKAAGAKYFVSMANHHDNYDLYNSKYHAWNSLNIGPKKDIVGLWAKLARKHGLRFGVSNHAAHAWHWWQTAYGYDTQGKYKDQRYDAFKLRKIDGLGKAWEGLDPQQLYCGAIASMVPPDGFKNPEEMGKFHDANSGAWTEAAPIENPAFTRNWLLRQNDLIEKYRPDYVYFDNYGLPLESAGLEATAHFYNQNIKWNGTNQAVVTGKKLNDKQMLAIVDDVEKGFLNDKRLKTWQTCTCLGNWHYDRALFTNKAYKNALNIVQRLIDVVSKNGNLLLSVPMRGDGTIDSEEENILKQIAQWMKINQEAIFESIPYKLFGTGPTKMAEGMQNEGQSKAFTSDDIRFTQKNGYIYIFTLLWPENKAIKINIPDMIENPILLGTENPLKYTQNNGEIIIEIGENRPSFIPVIKAKLIA